MGVRAATSRESVPSRTTFPCQGRGRLAWCGCRKRCTGEKKRTEDKNDKMRKRALPLGKCDQGQVKPSTASTPGAFPSCAVTAAWDQGVTRPPCVRSARAGAGSSREKSGGEGRGDETRKRESRLHLGRRSVRRLSNPQILRHKVQGAVPKVSRQRRDPHGAVRASAPVCILALPLGNQG